MICIDAKKVIETRIAESMGFDKYKHIMEMIWKTNVSSDQDFQRTYNAFSRVRRNAEWRKVYYDLFETIKGEVMTWFLNIYSMDSPGRTFRKEHKQGDYVWISGVQERENGYR